MRQLIIKSLTMRNFKGEQNRTTFFNPDTTNIKGDNGLGKSRHVDAFLWCFYGKDSQDRAKDVFKSKDKDGNDIHHITTEVTAVVEWMGSEMKITRQLEEKWTTPRGTTELRYDGDVTKCFINDVPMSVKDFTMRINEIMVDRMFKMVCNPMYFLASDNMDWKKRREILIDMAGEDNELELSGEVKEMMLRKKDMSESDYKALISAKKKKAKEELSEIQPRIDQTIKMMPQPSDWVALRAELEKCDKAIEEYNKELDKKVLAEKAVQDKKIELNKKIANLELEGEKIAINSRSEYDKLMFEHKASVQKADSEITKVKIEVNLIQTRINMKKAEIVEHNNAMLKVLESKKELLEEYHELERKVYDEKESYCPFCGQLLPEADIKDKKMTFNSTKASRMEAIVTHGKKLANAVEASKQEINKLTAEIKELEANLSGLNDMYVDLYNKKQELKEPERKDVNLESIPQYKDIMQKIASLKEEYNSIGSSIAEKSNTEDVIKSLHANRDRINEELNNEKLIEKAKDETKMLEVKGRELASIIAECQREENLMMQYTKAKIESLESKINSMFEGVTFKMFDQTIAGNEFECCQALVDGVPYHIANSAGRMNAGLSIVNALAKYYDVSAPVWIDNAEGNNHIPETIGQRILLTVTKDKQLTVE